jgi:hypothetical protein
MIQILVNKIKRNLTMLLDMDLMLESMIKEKLKVSHLEEKVKFGVIPVKKMNSKLKGVIKDEMDSDFLEDADYVVVCTETQVAPAPAEEEKPEEETEEKPAEVSDDTSDEETEENVGDEEEDTEEETTDDTEEEDAEEPTFGDDETNDTEDDTEETDTEEDTEEETSDDEDEDEDDEDDEKKAMNESIKIQDLTSSMCTSVKAKTTTPKTSAPKAPSTKKSDCSKKKCESTKKDCKCEDKKCEKKEEKIDEAETKVTGEALRTSLHKALTNTFKSQLDENNELELKDIQATIEPTWIFKISLKKREAQKSDK